MSYGQGQASNVMGSAQKPIAVNKLKNNYFSPLIPRTNVSKYVYGNKFIDCLSCETSEIVMAKTHKLQGCLCKNNTQQQNANKEVYREIQKLDFL